jgi:putative Mg2+ transporter-C (MgtC) family protein
LIRFLARRDVCGTRERARDNSKTGKTKCPFCVIRHAAQSGEYRRRWSDEPPDGKLFRAAVARRISATCSGAPMISHVQMQEAVLRMVAAVLIGCVVGLDRNLHGKPTGVKTLGLVALGSCLVTMAGSAFVLSGSADNTNAGRVIQGVITGIGFLGAGVIVQHGSERKISGLTTAASIWVTAALGIVCGIGA